MNNDPTIDHCFFSVYSLFYFPCDDHIIPFIIYTATIHSPTLHCFHPVVFVSFFLLFFLHLALCLSPSWMKLFTKKKLYSIGNDVAQIMFSILPLSLFSYYSAEFSYCSIIILILVFHLFHSTNISKMHYFFSCFLDTFTVLFAFCLINEHP